MCKKIKISNENLQIVFKMQFIKAKKLEANFFKVPKQILHIDKM